MKIFFLSIKKFVLIVSLLFPVVSFGSSHNRRVSEAQLCVKTLDNNLVLIDFSLADTYDSFLGKIASALVKRQLIPSFSTEGLRLIWFGCRLDENNFKVLKDELKSRGGFEDPLYVAIRCDLRNTRRCDLRNNSTKSIEENNTESLKAMQMFIKTLRGESVVIQFKKDDSFELLLAKVASQLYRKGIIKKFSIEGLRLVAYGPVDLSKKEAYKAWLRHIETRGMTHTLHVIISDEARKVQDNKSSASNCDNNKG